MADKLPKHISTATLVDLLDVTPQSVTTLARKGELVRVGRGKFEFAASIKRYVISLRNTLRQRGGAEISQQASAERMRLSKEQADALALRNAAVRGELLDAGAVEREWSNILRGVRAAMLGVPPRVGQRLPHLTAQDLVVLDREIRDALAAVGQGAAEEQNAPREQYARARRVTRQAALKEGR